MGTFKEKLDKDLDRVFFDKKKFADEVVFNREGVDITLNGLFDEAFNMVDAGSSVEVSSVGPAVTLIASQVPSPVKRGDRLTINGKQYAFKDRHPDGFGLLVLLLEKVA